MKTTIPTATLFLAVAASAARADVTPGSYWVNEQFFEYGITHLPDFDQRRDLLPGDGDFYCVPTATMNMFAYASDHGFPGLPPTSAFAWQSPANYDYLTGQLAALGGEMNTSPFSGTFGSGWFLGARRWISDNGLLSQLTVTHYYAGARYAPTPSQLAQMGASGQLVSIAYGFYDVIGTYQGHPQIARDGGHAVTFSACEATGFAPTAIAVRDPADDSNYFGQSMFGDRWHDLDHHVVADCSMPECIGTMWSLDDDGGSSMRLIDEYFTLRPRTGHAFEPGGDTVSTVCPFQLDGSPARPGGFALPGSSITDVVLHPDLVDFVVLADWDLVRYRTLSGQPETLMTIPGAERLVYGRNRALYTFADGQLIRLDLDGDTPDQDVVFPSVWVDELAYDDARDEVVLLSITNGTLARYADDLGFVAEANLPGWMSVGGQGALAMHPDGGKAYFGSEASDRIYLADYSPGFFPVFSEFALDLPGPPTGLCFDDRGHLFVATAADVRELAEVAPGDWQPVPGSAFGAAPPGGRFRLSRSRTNHDPKLHDGPDRRHRHPDDIDFGDPVPDCPHDVAPNGAIDIDDVVAVILVFGVSGPDVVGDVDGSGTVTIDDVVSVILAWGACD